MKFARILHFILKKLTAYCYVIVALNSFLTEYFLDQTLYFKIQQTVFVCCPEKLKSRNKKKVEKNLLFFFKRIHIVLFCNG